MVFSPLVLVSQLGMGQLFIDFSISQKNMTNAADETEATIGGNQTNQTGGVPLEQVVEVLVADSAAVKINHNI
jgi:hypothetical protein